MLILMVLKFQSLLKISPWLNSTIKHRIKNSNKLNKFNSQLFKLKPPKLNNKLNKLLLNKMNKFKLLNNKLPDLLFNLLQPLHILMKNYLKFKLNKLLKIMTFIILPIMILECMLWLEIIMDITLLLHKLYQDLEVLLLMVLPLFGTPHLKLNLLLKVNKKLLAPNLWNYKPRPQSKLKLKTKPQSKLKLKPKPLLNNKLKLKFPK